MGVACQSEVVFFFRINEILCILPNSVYGSTLAELVQVDLLCTSLLTVRVRFTILLRLWILSLSGSFQESNRTAGVLMVHRSMKVRLATLAISAHQFAVGMRALK